MNFEMAKGNSSEDIVRATQKALIISMKQFVKELQEEIKQPGLTWDQVNYLLESFEKKQPVIFEQAEEM